jgi:hypothetical protein
MVVVRGEEVVKLEWNRAGFMYLGLSSGRGSKVRFEIFANIATSMP